VRHRAPDLGEAGGDVRLTFELGRHRDPFDRTLEWAKASTTPFPRFLAAQR
jgi:hypothetical protein